MSQIPRFMLAPIFALWIGAGLCAGAERPNIVVILSDDMGFSDLGCYGGEIRTPNLDRLAQGGLRFTQFYNNARCCPTRASLLTGLYPHQAGIGHMMDDRGVDAYRGDLSLRAATIAEVLKPAGYRSYALGKWHVTRHIRPDAPKHNWPIQRGFDRYYGTIQGADSYFDPATLTRDNRPISAFADPEYTPKTYYYTDALSDHAVRFIGDHARDRKDQPFFLYLAYTAAHWPMHALPEDVAKTKGRYDSGYEAIRKARFAKATKLDLIDPGQGLSATAVDWNAPREVPWEVAGMEVYAAMVERMDQGIGRVVAELERTGKLENTLILYLQDNGACAELQGRKGMPDHPDIPRPERPTLAPLAADALLPATSVPPQTREGFPVRMGQNAEPGPGDTYVAYGRGWANVSNTPFREYKHWIHEGGISTPLVAHWPRGIAKEKQGGLVRFPSHLIDLMATVVELSGATYPSEFGGTKTAGLPGVSLKPTFAGGTPERPDPIFWEHEGNRGVRQGSWKLVSKFPGSWELYRIDQDRVEAKDLSRQNPELTAELAGKWREWSKRVGVRSWPFEATKKAKAQRKKADD